MNEMIAIIIAIVPAMGKQVFWSLPGSIWAPMGKIFYWAGIDAASAPNFTRFRISNVKS
jgi:hypothetical protein